jgi:hypothetical protein
MLLKKINFLRESYETNWYTLWAKCKAGYKQAVRIVATVLQRVKSRYELRVYARKSACDHNVFPDRRWK